MSNCYRGAKAALATMHGKASVVGPAMAAHLGLEIVTAAGIDTDVLGTFTGETPRIGTMRDVAVRKARLGMRASRLTIGIANEGSFGPHPVIPFLRVGMELMVFVDDERDLVITESLVAEQTNHDVATASDISELDAFLGRVLFPTHGLIVRPNLTDSPWWKLHPELVRIFKGLVTPEALARAISEAARVSEDGRAQVMTDMRAHMNPTRMKTISDLAARLARRVATECPACGTPGFGRIALTTGIPCAVCDTESIVPGGDVMGCATCDCKLETRHIPVRQYAEAGECPRCNP
jgi:hypothetical protein